MSDEKTGVSGAKIAVGAVAVVLALAGGFAYVGLDRPGQTNGAEGNPSEPAKADVEATPPKAEAEVAEPETPAAPPAEPAAAEPTITQAEEAVPAAPATLPPLSVPLFDLVRVEPDGSALIAGKAEAGSRISVRLDGVEAAATDTDAGGKFVAIFSLEPSDQPRVMTLLSRVADGREMASSASVIVEPSRKPEVQVAEASEASAPPVEEGQAEPATDVASGVPEADAVPEGAQTDEPAEAVAAAEAPSVEVPAEEPPLAEASALEAAPAVPAAAETAAAEPASTEPEATTPEATEPAAAEPAVVAVTESEPDPAATEKAAEVSQGLLLADETGVKVLQSGGDALPQALVIDTISYDPSGQVTLGGRGEAQSALQVYLDNASLTAGRIGEDGAWSILLPDVAPGLYTLRVDQMDDAGKVTSRYETPFKREDPQALAQLDAAPAEAADVVAALPEPDAAEPAATPSPAPEPAPEPAPAAETVAAAPATAPAADLAAPQPAPARTVEPAAEPAKVPETQPAVPEPAPAVAAAPAPAPPPAPEPAAPALAPAVEEPATEPAAPAPALAAAEPVPAAPAEAEPVPAPVTEGVRVRIVTVQPGFTLWKIASEAYGEGVLYVQVFEANKDRIRDPDLIYPGQVFSVPEPAN